MGVLFSREIHATFDHINATVPYLRFTLWIIILTLIICTVLFTGILVAIVALLISVNPDLSEERKTYVTPFLQALLRVPSKLCYMTLLTIRAALMP